MRTWQWLVLGGYKKTDITNQMEITFNKAQNNRYKKIFEENVPEEHRSCNKHWIKFEKVPENLMETLSTINIYMRKKKIFFCTIKKTNIKQLRRGGEDSA